MSRRPKQREAILELLRDRGGEVRTADIIAAIQARGLATTESSARRNINTQLKRLEEDGLAVWVRYGTWKARQPKTEAAAS